MASGLMERGTEYSVDDLSARLLPELRRVDGLTISGGEPLLQAGPLAALVARLRETMPDLEVLVYTGYTPEQARQMGDEVARLLDHTDILIDGPFLEEEPNRLVWRGSDNQRVHLISPRAAKYEAESGSEWEEPRPIGIQMLTPDSFRIVGIPRRGDVARYRATLAASGLIMGDGTGASVDR